MSVPTKDWIAFAEAIEAAFPHDAPRDRFGRFSGPRNVEPLRQLGVKYKITSGGQDSQDQAGMVARAMLAAEKGK